MTSVKDGRSEGQHLSFCKVIRLRSVEMSNSKSRLHYLDLLRHSRWRQWVHTTLIILMVLSNNMCLRDSSLHRSYLYMAFIQRNGLFCFRKCSSVLQRRWNMGGAPKRQDQHVLDRLWEVHRENQLPRARNHWSTSVSTRSQNCSFHFMITLQVNCRSGNILTWRRRKTHTFSF